MKSICEAKPLDEYNDTVDKVILVQRIAQSPKAIIALLAENRRLARRVAKLERVRVATIAYKSVVAHDAGLRYENSAVGKELNAALIAARIARRKRAEEK